MNSEQLEDNFMIIKFDLMIIFLFSYDVENFDLISGLETKYPENIQKISRMHDPHSDPDTATPTLQCPHYHTQLICPYCHISRQIFTLPKPHPIIHTDTISLVRSPLLYPYSDVHTIKPPLKCPQSHTLTSISTLPHPYLQVHTVNHLLKHNH